jgi:hypothetical protein
MASGLLGQSARAKLSDSTRKSGVKGQLGAAMEAKIALSLLWLAVMVSARGA